MAAPPPRRTRTRDRPVGSTHRPDPTGPAAGPPHLDGLTGPCTDGEDTFELVIWAGYNIGYEDEWDTLADPDRPDLAVLADGGRMPLDQLRRSGFDAIALSRRGRTTEVVQEELA